MAVVWAPSVPAVTGTGLEPPAHRVRPAQLRRVVPGLDRNSSGMIKNFLSSKILGAASAETFIIGVKLSDVEAHHIRIFGFILLAISSIILVREWRHKASAQAAAESQSVKTINHIAKASRKHNKRARR